MLPGWLFGGQLLRDRIRLGCRCMPRSEKMISGGLVKWMLNTYSVHGSSGNETSFDKFMWILAHDLSVFASSRFTFICIDHQVTRFVVLVPVLEVHERL